MRIKGIYQSYFQDNYNLEHDYEQYKLHLVRKCLHMDQHNGFSHMLYLKDIQYSKYTRVYIARMDHQYNHRYSNNFRYCI